jgi:probable phosphoglycerate mutase
MLEGEPIPKSRSLYILRHAECTDNASQVLNGRRDTFLTENGKIQALQMGQELKRSGTHISRIYMSPMVRAQLTALIIARVIGVSYPYIDICGELRERDFGILTGKPVSDVGMYATKIFETGNIIHFLEAPQAENFNNVRKRAQSFLSRLRSTPWSDTSLVVTHGDIGTMIIAEIRGIDTETALRDVYIGNSEYVHCEIPLVN